MAGGRAMIIGLDGVTWDLLTPWMAEGRLPHLAALAARGATGPRRSTLPAMSPAAWSTFITGCNPGKHGVLDFYQFRSDSYEPHLMNAARRHGATFWEVAGGQGVTCGIINVPFTFPPRPCNGFVVGCMLSPGLSRKMTEPPAVFDDLMRASPEYQIDVDVLNASVQKPQHFLDNVLGSIQRRLDAAVGLYRQHSPQLFCVVFVAADRAAHFLWPYMEAGARGEAHSAEQRRLADGMRSVYERLDAAVGALVKEAGDEADILVLSDHGSGPLRKALNLTGALSAEGLLTRHPRTLADAAKEALVWTFAHYGPPGLKRKVKDRFPGLSRRAASALCQHIDYARTKAFPAGQTGGVFINLRGRQPYGIVEPGMEYEDVRNHVIELLSGLTDPQTGKRIARKAHRREDIWSGPCLEQLPDVLLEQEEEEYAVPLFPRSRSDGALYDLPRPNWRRLHPLGGHRRDGILLAAGPHVCPGRVSGARMEDVPPTALALLNCAVPESFDGRVLREILRNTEAVRTAQDLSAPEATGAEELSAEERAALMRRLQGLGYIS